MATHEFFQSHNFLYVHTPLITGADCEGAGTLERMHLNQCRGYGIMSFSRNQNVTSKLINTYRVETRMASFEI